MCWLLGARLRVEAGRLAVLMAPQLPSRSQQRSLTVLPSLLDAVPVVFLHWAHPSLLGSCCVLVFRVLFHTILVVPGGADVCSTEGAGRLLGCPSARQRGRKEGRSSLLPCCPVLPSPAQPCSPGCCSENGFLGRLGHQCHVDTSTAIRWCGASTCSGARTHQSSTKCWGEGRGIFGSFRGSVEARQAPVWS